MELLQEPQYLMKKTRNNPYLLFVECLKILTPIVPVWSIIISADLAAVHAHYYSILWHLEHQPFQYIDLFIKHFRFTVMR